MDTSKLRITELQEKALEYALIRNLIEVTDENKEAFLQARLNDTLTGYVNLVMTEAKKSEPVHEKTEEEKAAEVTSAVAFVEATKTAIAAEKQRQADEAAAANP